MKRAGKKFRFTLIELVAVIAIAAVMMTLIGIAFEGLGKGNKVDNAASSIGNALNLAQSQAVSRREYVAVLFARDTSGAGVKSLRNHPYGAFRLAYVTKPTTGNTWTIKRFVPNSDWEMLPVGTIVAKISGNSANITATSGFDPVYATPPVVGVASGTLAPGVADSELKALVFNSKGVVVSATADTYLVVVDCITDGMIVTAADNARQIKINRFTGVVSYEDFQ